MLSGVLDDAGGEEFASQVRQSAAPGGKVIVDGSGLTGLDQEGLLHLMKVQKRISTPERKRLLLAGFGPALWRSIVENGGDFLFESQPTLAEALKVLGVASAPAVLPSAVPRAAAPSASETVAPREPDAWQRPTATAAPASPPARAGSPEAATGWENYQGPVRAPASTAPKGIPRRVLLYAGIGLAAVLLVAALWWLLAHRAPTLTVSTSSVVAEEGGKEVDSVRVTVRRGRLKDESWQDLPKGITFGQAEENSTEAYVLQGSANNGARSATVQLVAESPDGSKTSEPVAFTVTIKPKPLTWQLNTLQSLGLRVGEPIKAASKFVTGALKKPEATGLPAGVEVKAAPGNALDWQLAGTPTAAGQFNVRFTVQTGDATEEKSCSLEVAAAAPATPASATTSPGPAATAAGEAKPAADPNAGAGVDDGLRKFLLERIEKLPSRYTQEDRENLRLVVGGLKQARLLCKVLFEKEGQVEISAAESAKLKTAMQAPENARLLKEAGCQVVVVGYASTTGSPAANIRYSKLRAKAVEEALRQTLGRNADLCGDYGPTDAADLSGSQLNRAVEVYAGAMDLPRYLWPKAESFKQDFNRRHGAH